MVRRTANAWLSKGANLLARVTIGRAIGLVAACVVALTAVSCGDDEVTGTETVSFTQEPGVHAQYLESRDMPYAIAIPSDYSPNVGTPLVLALHWGGETSTYAGGQLLTGLVGPALGELKAIFVAPDAVSGDWSNTTAEADLLVLMDAIQANYNIAPGKTLIVGYSMGGAGVWYMAERHPERFAGGIPIAAPPPANVLDVSWQIPIFIVHSRDDEIVSFDEVNAAYNGLYERDLDVNMVAANGLRHHDSASYGQPLASTVPWIQTLWE